MNDLAFDFKATSTISKTKGIRNLVFAKQFLMPFQDNASLKKLLNLLKK
jgi:hypothetical protein